MMRIVGYLVALILLSAVVNLCVESAPQAYTRRDPGHPQWHHGAFQDVKDSVRSDVREMLHSRAEVCLCVGVLINLLIQQWNRLCISSA